MEDPTTLWPTRIPEDARQFLYTEARQAVVEQGELVAQQTSKALSLFVLAASLIGVGGVFGDIEISWSIIGVGTGVAFVAFVAATICAGFVYMPRGYGTTPDIASLAKYVDPPDGGPDPNTRDALRNAGLEVLIEEYEKNVELTRRRGWALRVLFVVVAVEVTLVAALELTAGLLA